MTPPQLFGAAMLALVLAQPARAGELPLQNGAYEVTTRLELPHLERWAIDKTMTICLPAGTSEGEIPIPVLSGNNPFAKCRAINLASDGQSLQYDIACPGRGAASAHAAYTLSPRGFAGHIAMVMGAKNMTMVEIQHARRLGACGPIAAETAARF